jgi:DNA-binding transcriptional regulator GbsR (MarR family)
MARVHALLMISEIPLSTDDIMAELAISRGNANMNLRGLMDWGLVKKVAVDSERREFFESESDIWNMCCRIARERKRREVEPVIGTLEACLKESKEGKQAAAFRRKLTELLELVKLLDFILGKLAMQEKNDVLPKVLKLMKAMS